MESKAPAILLSWHSVDAALSLLQSLIERQNFLRQPHTFQKYSHKSGASQTRLFALSPSGTALEWHGIGLFARKSSVLLSDIVEIINGNNEFACSKPRINLRLDPPDQCLTIKTTFGTLHLVSESKEQRDEWVQALRSVVTDKQSVSDFKDSVKAFQGELSAIVEEFARTDIKLKNATSDLKSLQEENQLLKDEMTILKEKLVGREVEEVKREMEDYYNALLVEKDQELLAQEKTVKALTWKLQEVDRKSTASVFSLENRLVEMETKASQAEAALTEFKETTKQKMAEAVEAKVGQYLHSNKMLTSYISHLKKTLEDLEKEVTLWKSAVYHFALVQFLEEYPEQDKPTMRGVLQFALDHLERHYHSISTQRELIDILSQTRSLRSRQTLSLAVSTN